MNRYSRYTFKAKRKDNGEWVYGYYVELPKINAMEIFNGGYAEDTASYIVVNKNRQHPNFPNSNPIEVVISEQYEILPETLCQCTGLKDRDDKDIFENDIVSSNANLGYGKRQKKVEIISEVIYLILNNKTMSGLDTNQCSMFTTRQLNKEQDYTNVDWSVFFNCKIIGNKFDKEED